jgi:hypothetical protein
VTQLFLQTPIGTHVAHAHDLTEQIAIMPEQRTDRHRRRELTAVAAHVRVVTQTYTGFDDTSPGFVSLARVFADNELLELHVHELALAPAVFTRRGRIGVAHSHLVENEDGMIDGGERGGQQMFALAGETFLFVEQQCVECQRE